eukprot:TRINITY_DN7439_c0_g1_i1.p1 TRINITY_DN7439_c0_g1~~TRINITY_DN7439_c0_g1_i1.p1  ORF type:complete len:200 (-),score=25.92 TRINITY_DN7439_c0_g1_i1:17-616(-)
MRWPKQVVGGNHLRAIPRLDETKYLNQLHGTNEVLLMEGIFYFEVQITNANWATFSMGITSVVQRSNYGRNDLQDLLHMSWGGSRFWAHLDGTGQHQIVQLDHEQRPNMTLGYLVDWDRDLIVLTRSSHIYQVLHFPRDVVRQIPWKPAIGYANQFDATISVNFGMKPFRFDIDTYRKADALPLRIEIEIPEKKEEPQK